jgi:hypothetical protein
VRTIPHWEQKTVSPTTIEPAQKGQIISLAAATLRKRSASDGGAFLRRA